MPQVLILVAAGAGLILAGRWLRDVQRRVQAELSATEEALKRRDAERAVPLERDPSTGIYRPRHVSKVESNTRH
jgi:hypothetical protein